MKFISAVLLLCVAVVCIQCESAKEKAVALANECKGETGATDADVEAFIKHESASTGESKCMRACVLRKLGVLTDDGHLIKDAAIEVTKLMANGDAEKEAVGVAVIEQCAALDVEEDDCEAAEQYSVCFKEHAAEKGLKFDDA